MPAPMMIPTPLAVTWTGPRTRRSCCSPANGSPSMRMAAASGDGHQVEAHGRLSSRGLEDGDVLARAAPQANVEHSTLFGPRSEHAVDGGVEPHGVGSRQHEGDGSTGVVAVEAEEH